MKRLNQIVTITMAAFTGAFLGHGLYLSWDYHVHPELYKTPWYAQLLVPGIVLVCVLGIGGILKGMIHSKEKKP